jgi:hypothetical protein
MVRWEDEIVTPAYGEVVAAEPVPGGFWVATCGT